MQAMILAAGMGRRLKDLTIDMAKCMVKVNGIPLIERVLHQLNDMGLSRIIIVVGHKADALMAYIESLEMDTPLVFVYNPIYQKTNNIYSLFLARQYLLEEDTILLESDLIFEKELLSKLVNDSYPSLALVAKFESWMDGTVVTLDNNNCIKQFIMKKDFDFKEASSYYKTVNIYKFGKQFSTSHYVPFLEAYCSALGNNVYYEQVLKVISLLDKPEIKALQVSNEPWYEIDTIQDLDIAESIFADEKNKLEKIQKRYGGYWRYPSLRDFCYLVNPYFPTPKMLDEIRRNIGELITKYPSGSLVNRLLIANYYNLDISTICIGNGAAELIKVTLDNTTGEVGIIFPTFQEYPNRLPSERIVKFYPSDRDFRYTADDLIAFYANSEISNLVLVNSDNPTGNFIPKQEMLRLLDWTKQRDIRLILDESFIDFAEGTFKESLMDKNTIRGFKNLVLIKSISKSYGVAGCRLGFLTSADNELVHKVNSSLPIWNINSIGEFFLQIFDKYKADYNLAIKKLIKARTALFSKLLTISFLRPLNSNANFICCEVLSPYSATELTSILINQYDILVKDLSGKEGFGERQFIRIAIEKPEDNELLIKTFRAMESGAIKDVLSEKI